MKEHGRSRLTLLLVEMRIMSAFLFVWCAASVVQADETYYVYDLGLPLNFDYAIPWRINNQGIAVGYGHHSTSHQLCTTGVQWTYRDTIQFNGTPGTECSAARGLNDLGQIAGYNSSLPPYTLGKEGWVRDNGHNNVFRLSEGAYTTAHDINNAGQVVGVADLPYQAYAAVFDADGIRDAKRLPLTHDRSSPHDINDKGQVVGSVLLDPTWHSFLWDPNSGEVTLLESLGGSWSEAWQINEAGRIVGFAETADERSRAFVYVDGTMIPLPLLEGYTDSAAIGINNANMIVGHVQIEDGYLQAVAWYPDLTILVLPPLNELDHTRAFGVNDKGQIVGTSGQHPVIWTQIKYLDGRRPIDIGDLAVLAASWGLEGEGLPGDIWPPGGDGRVDIRDLAALLQNWLD